MGADGGGGRVYCNRDDGGGCDRFAAYVWNGHVSVFFLSFVDAKVLMEMYSM